MSQIIRVFIVAVSMAGLFLAAGFTQAKEQKKLDAGDDVTVAFPNPVALNGVVNDPEPPHLSIGWMKADGPGEVNFENRRSAVTMVTFSEPGRYTLALGGYDGAVAYDEVIVTVTR